jgi:tetratricopeptide (TPR) repeat protein
VDSLDPGDCAVATAIARVQAALGRTDEALAAIRAARERCPGDAEALALHAEVMASVGDDKGVETELTAAVSDSSPADLLALLAESLIAQGRVEEAERMYAERCAADSLSPMLAFLHARVLMKCDRREDAASELLRAERLDPSNQAVAGALGELLLDVGRAQEAVPRLERIVTSADAPEGDVAALSRAYCEVGEPDRAVALVEDAIVERGERPGLLVALGGAHFRRGDIDSAFRAYERVLAADPDAVVALNFVAYSLAENNTDLDRALELAERAARLAPTAPEVLDTLGWVYHRLGRESDARREIEEALALGDESAEVHEHLGDVLHALGLEDEAAAAWRRALEVEPGRGSAAAKLEGAARESRP